LFTKEYNMHSLTRSLVHLAYIALACAPLSATLAVDAPDSAARIGGLVKSAGEQIGLIRNELDRIESNLGRAAPATGATGGFSGGRQQYSELKRYVGSLADIGNDVARFASKCVEEARDVAGRFRSQTSRLRSSADQVESADSSSMAEMRISKMRRDLEATEAQLQSVAGIAGGCSS
jgi:hypothetical protein